VTRIEHQQPSHDTTDSKQDSTRSKKSSKRRSGRGGKLRLEPADIQAHPVAGAWIEAVRRTVGDDDLEWGLRTAKAGRVRSLDIGTGLVSANVSEEGEGGRRVTLSLPVLSDEDWDRIEERMTGEAVWTARLSADEFPTNLPELFVECGLSLVPAEHESLSCRTNGPLASGQRRAAAVAWLAAERLALDPLMMLEMRGRSVRQIVERIRRRRTLDLTGGSAAHPDPVVLAELDPVTDLSDDVEHFWRSKQDTEQMGLSSPIQHVPHALLRRLGPSTLEGKFPLAGLLATIYDLVGERSRAMLDGEDDSRN
jgi:uncharacterized Zn finger protein